MMLGENIIVWAVAGALGGWLAGTVVKRHGGSIADLLSGCLGGLLAGWIFSWYGHLGFTSINVASDVVALLGGVVMLSIARLFRVKKTA